MANPIKGEVSFLVGAATMVLVYDFNALCSIEQDLDIKVEDVGTSLNSATTVRSVFRIGLEAKHGAMTDLEAGNIIYQMGMREAVEAIGRAFQAAFPEVSAGDPSPRKPARSKAGTSPAP